MWEYYFEVLHGAWYEQQREAIKLGRLGWELVHVDGGIFYFKRPLREGAAPHE